ncbi:hypothetical protein QJ48_08095 [Paenibacillus sp. A3]|uniref:hypothetical protein n=1 Tax=Paenibacillus sp. A3 TaxID=1337054 RepID=UPI0006D55F95|nr:hypothetical protein [Paenibacillus sp. A3]KPV60009.1 hypothetical protein QJ48_08095 [Paenibacillus sp. A3]
MYSFYFILKRDFINLALNPVLLLTNTVFPLLLVLVLGYLSNGAYSGETMNGYDYYSGKDQRLIPAHAGYESLFVGRGAAKRANRFYSSWLNCHWIPNLSVNWP